MVSGRVAATKLISITPKPEEVILFCARASSDQENADTKLIKYLIKHHHWSPFEMAFAVFEIRTSRAIAQQILRHRSFSFQEFSQRYAESPGVIVYPPRRQADKNRQSSIDDLSEDLKSWWMNKQFEIEGAAVEAYKEALNAGIAKECARFVLPQATETKLYMAGTMRSWIHYFDIRCDEHTQFEHREIALEIRGTLSIYVPTIAEALNWLE